MSSSNEHANEDSTLQAISTGNGFQDCHYCNCKIEADHSVQVYENVIRSNPAMYNPMDWFRAKILRVVVQVIIHNLHRNQRMQMIKPKVKLDTLTHPLEGRLQTAVWIDCRTDSASTISPSERLRRFPRALEDVQKSVDADMKKLRTYYRPSGLQWVLCFQDEEPEPSSWWPWPTDDYRMHFIIDRIRQTTNLDIKFPLLIDWPRSDAAEA
ncbi:hypothetical protein PFICI_01751 [Pestalotiopsis fici W106-1]|uniref:Uncharacterized protein n=1 Tax=Pestalotiopsis fici (strain W106-1 / CGMCC3.15140) TaxID=1229662 RepID=W3XPD7_PESFW|nr:uncharacterized protein PFICI_01751 [Pestalotiopsis fici W106-1]ETS87923.1 hypothetical protein PFICI_01751 [Pestalotiopsis fici W106-1]